MDEQPEQVHELHRRASDWYEAHGDRAEAIGHAMAGEDFERAARLIELAAPMMRQARQESTLRRWLEALPGDLFDARPVLSITLVGARMVTGDSTGVEQLFGASSVGWTRRDPTPADRLRRGRVLSAPRAGRDVSSRACAARG